MSETKGMGHGVMEWSSSVRVEFVDKMLYWMHEQFSKKLYS